MSTNYNYVSDGLLYPTLLMTFTSNIYSTIRVCVYVRTKVIQQVALKGKILGHVPSLLWTMINIMKLSTFIQTIQKYMVPICSSMQALKYAFHIGTYQSVIDGFCSMESFFEKLLIYVLPLTEQILKFWKVSRNSIMIGFLSKIFNKLVF